MRFLIDQQLPLALVGFFQGKGCESQHVLQIGMESAPDLYICQYALDQNQIIVSKDQDFFYLSQSQGVSVRLLWVRLGNCRKQALLAALSQHWVEISGYFDAGDRVVELR